MATNFFFNNFQASQEQLLLEDLVIEAIKIYGHDVYYLPRKLNNYDDVYGADDISSYESSYPVEMYIKSIDGFTGDGEFLSKFGVEIRNQVVFSIARRRFNDDVGEFTSQVRPNEGDIIYFPLNQRSFIIRFVNKYEMFYQLGALQTWEMTCDVFEYSGESFNTGIPEVDIIQKNNSTNILDWTIDSELSEEIKTEDGDYLIQEGKSATDIVASDDADEIQKESDMFVDFSAADPFSEGNI
jgi:Virus neck protein